MKKIKINRHICTTKSKIACVKYTKYKKKILKELQKVVQCVSINIVYRKRYQWIDLVRR